MLSPLAGYPVSRFAGSNRPTGQLPPAFCRLPTVSCLLPAGRTAGQSTIELSILVAIVVAALVTMSIYLRRGYQGYLRNTSQVHGVQFDPTQPYAGSQRLNQYTRDQTIDIVSGEASVPVIGGTLPARTLTTKVRTVTGWEVARDANYQAQ